MRTNLFIIAKEGWNPLFITAAVFLFFWIFNCELLQFITFVVFLAFLYIYRNPERVVPFYQDGSVISPVDGEVTQIEELVNEQFAYKITINSGLLHVGILRAPMSGTVKNISTVRGARLGINATIADKINENSELLFSQSDERTVKVKHRLKQSLDAIHIYPKEGDTTPQGIRYGMAVNGVTEVYLPHNFRINVRVGDTLEGSVTLVGYFS